MSTLKATLQAATMKIRKAVGLDYTPHGGLRLPMAAQRFCTEHYRDKSFYVRSADAEVARLVQRCGLTSNSRLLDIGFGQGRLAIGLLRWNPTFAGYWGVDIHGPSVDWCRQHLGAFHPHFRFIRLLAANRRYNAEGQPISDGFRLPFDDAGFDVMFLYSVFTHMDEDDVKRYLEEMKRTLAPKGAIFATVFVEDDVEPFQENPEDYLTDMYPRLDGALHIVRFQRAHFEAMVQRAGLRVAELRYREEAHLNQSTVVLKHADE
jgi:ubiquinone/menaquinone biosynthesis C-methylase UbiE